MRSHILLFFFQQTVAYLLLTVAYAVASTLVFEAHTDDSSTPSLQNWTKNQTLIVAVSYFNQFHTTYQNFILDYFDMQDFCGHN